MSKSNQSKRTSLFSSAEKPEINVEDVVKRLPTTKNNVTFTYFNLNGTRHQLTNYAFAFLGHAAREKGYEVSNPENGQREFFFTRNNVSFVAIIEYLENGELHMPMSVCPLAFQKEMQFWGIKVQNLETCCKRRLSENARTEQLLNDFSHTFHRSRLTNQKKVTASSWENIRRYGWDILDAPSSSNWAKLCFAIKSIAVIIFVFTSIASTHWYFQEELSDDELQNYINENKAAFAERCQVEKDKQELPSLQLICRILHESSSENHALSLQKRNVIDYEMNNDGIHIGAAYFEGKSLVNKTQYSEENVENDLVYPQRDQNPSDSTNEISEGSVQLVKQDQSDNYNDTSSIHKPTIKPPAYLLDGNLTHNNQTTISTSRNNRSKRSIVLDLNKMRVGKIHNPDHLDCNQTAEETKLIITKPYSWLESLEIALGLYFVVEYLLELIFAPDKLSHILSFYSVVDLINIICGACIYFYYEVFHKEFKHTENPFELINAIVSIKTLKLFTVVKDLRGFRVLMFSIKTSYRDVLTFMLYLMILVVIPSFFMYYLEKENMQSIPGAMWWTLVTVTTVGYGDKVPTTGLGRCLGVVCAISGILVLALFVPLFVNDFMIFNKFSKEKHNHKKNPLKSLMSRSHCQHSIAK